MGRTNGMDKKTGFGLLILSISLASFMASLDGTIVNIALPTISTSFGVSTSTVSWVATAYLLVMAGCVLIFGKVADVIGFKRVFLSGFLIFTLGSFSCGLLPDMLNSFVTLVGSRIFQAVGGAMIASVAPAMVTAYIPMSQKGKAMGYIMTAAALGMAIGPTIGGLLTQYISWHWIFFINVPIGIFAILLGAKEIPSSGTAAKLSGFDRSGAALIFVGLAFLLFGVSEGQELGWTSPVILLTLALAVISIGYFIWHELHASDPLLELRLFKNKNFFLLNLVMVLVFFSFSGINYLLPFYLEYVLGFSTAAAGLILTSLSFAMMASGILAGLAFTRFGGRALCVAAGIMLTVGYYLMTQLRLDSTVGFVVMALVIIGFGLGLMVTPASSLIMNAVAKKYSGMVSSLTSLERFAPMTIGIAFFNLVFIQGIIAIAAYHGVTSEAPKNIQMHVLSAGFDLAYMASFILGIVIFILALFIRQEIHPDYLEEQDDEPVIGIL